jgi:hypothetical protein
MSHDKAERLTMDNQTEEFWLVGISQAGLGTGLFVFPSSYDDFGQTNWCKTINSEVYGSIRKALLADINYLDCVKRGSHKEIIAYKWIPLSLASFDTVKAAATACGTVLCVKRCAGYGCACVGGECK